MINKITVRFTSNSSNEALSRIIITGFIMPLNPNVEEIADVKTAVSEAVTNCIVHAYKNNDNEIIELRATYTDKGKLAVSIKDYGCGIENIELARQPLYTTDKENERSGMGFSIMESFSDKIKVVSTVGKGTKVTLIKRICGNKQ
ncbi:MAG: anti-sigma F factor [Ruminococcaceae bacterium]|nr:anti-sigma F factor [Oscillospiraceae bacterium]